MKEAREEEDQNEWAPPGCSQTPYPNTSTDLAINLNLALSLNQVLPIPPSPRTFLDLNLIPSEEDQALTETQAPLPAPPNLTESIIYPIPNHLEPTRQPTRLVYQPPCPTYQSILPNCNSTNLNPSLSITHPNQKLMGPAPMDHNSLIFTTKGPCKEICFSRKQSSM